MKNPVKQIEFDVHGLVELTDAIRAFLLKVDARRKSKESVYRNYLATLFYDRLTKRLNNMLLNGRKITRVKFDTTHCMLMVDVLANVAATKLTLQVIYHLGSSAMLTTAHDENKN